MAFAEKVRAFTRIDIEALDPDQIGCYGLYNASEWVYIGRGDIRQRLLDHLNGDNGCIKGRGPTHWLGVVTADSVAEEKRLILQYNPVCNMKVG